MEDAIKDPSLQDTTAALAEVALDAALDPGVLKDVPMIGTIIGLVRAAHNIRDRLFLQKLRSFLVGLQDIDARQRKDMIDRVNESGTFRITVGQKLLYILDRCADHPKRRRSSQSCLRRSLSNTSPTPSSCGLPELWTN